ncbi:MAG: NTP transferase domain-containing protein [bacterium]
MQLESVSAIILAAGESKRMGHPKALMRFGKQTFLQTVISNVQQAGVESILVVLGHAKESIIPSLRNWPVEIVINENYRTGQFSSFQTALKKLKPDCAGTLLVLVDQPQIGSEVIRKVLSAFQRLPEKIIIPSYQNRRGHPPLIPQSLFQEIVQAPPDWNASALIADHAEIVHEVEVHDESILWNINTLEDLKIVNAQLNL